MTRLHAFKPAPPPDNTDFVAVKSALIFVGVVPSINAARAV